MRIDGPTRWWFRARRSYLFERLPPGSLARAAEVGIQDSAPRAGLLSLAARVEEVGPDSWEDPSLVQVWHRGGAVHIVPRSEAHLFTMGSLPRDRDERRALDALADEVHRFLDGSPRRMRDVSAAVPLARWTGRTGRVHIRWDARDTLVIPADAPDVDLEAARLDLARRFVWGFGPTTAEDFPWWAGVSRADGLETWSRITNELTAVEVGKSKRWILEDDAVALRDAEPVAGVRLLPMNDHFLVLDPPRRRDSILVDGEVRGVFRRQQGRVTLVPSRRLPVARRPDVEAEAKRWAAPLGRPVRVEWAAE